MDTPFSKYPSADALMPKVARTKAKRGVSRPGLKNDPPGAREARRRPHDQETLWPISAYSLRMLHKVGPLCLLRSRGQPERQRARPGEQQSAGQRRFRSFAELCGLRLLKLPSDSSGKRFRAFLPRGAPNTGALSSIPKTHVSIIAARGNLYDSRSTLTAVPAPLPLGVYRSRGG